MIAGFILEFILLLVSLGLITASAAEKSWNMAMIAYVLCAVAAAIISAFMVCSADSSCCIAICAAT